MLAVPEPEYVEIVAPTDHLSSGDVLVRKSTVTSTPEGGGLVPMPNAASSPDTSACDTPSRTPAASIPAYPSTVPPSIDAAYPSRVSESIDASVERPPGPDKEEED